MIAGKVCTGCGVEKDDSEFHGRAGKLNARCKSCANAKSRAYAAANREYFAEWRAANRGRYARPKHAELVAVYPIEEAARAAVRRAVKSGKLIKPTHCEGECGQPFPKEKLEGHHHDYSKPLDVSWYCRVCHGEVHRKINEALRAAEAEPMRIAA